MVIQGERGLGKEMWVKAIHNSGRYAQQELVILTAACISDLVAARYLMRRQVYSAAGI